MLKIKETILVEGRYDKNTLSQAVDAVIIQCGGFGIFNDKQKQRLIRTMAERNGLIVLTDSDSAGFVIRNFIRSCTEPSQVKHAYIPDVYGKERRKRAASKEGKLGVEGMRPQQLEQALLRAGATVEGQESDTAGERITKADMYKLGLSGGEGSREKRARLLKKLELPERMSADAMLDVLNAIMTRREFFAMEHQ